MGMAEQTQAFQSTGLSGYCERAELKIKHFHEGSKAIGKAVCAFRALLFMEKALL